MIAKRNDWKAEKMPKENITIDISEKISKSEMQEIKKGRFKKF